MFFCTDNSVYEVDEAGYRIRRLEGRNQPTSRQGADADWKKYIGISPIELGSQVVIVWRVVGDTVQATYTSPVRQIVAAVN